MLSKMFMIKGITSNLSWLSAFESSPQSKRSTDEKVSEGRCPPAVDVVVVVRQVELGGFEEQQTEVEGSWRYLAVH